MTTKLIIGLGNPGSEYAKTRHNTGHIVIDELLRENLPKNTIVRKTTVFMNQSGDFVRELCSKYSIAAANLFVIHDDLDIVLGEYKIQFGRGPKDHNGLASVDEALATDEYWHVRVGIDNRPLDNRPMGEEYVLQNFSDEEKVILDRTIKEIANKLISIFNAK